MATVTITMDAGRMSGVLRRGLAELAAAGVAVRPEQLAELIELDDLIGQDGGGPDLAVLADAPVWCGGVALYRPTLGAMAAMDRVLAVSESAHYRADVALAWLAGHARDGAAIVAATRDAQAFAEAMEPWLARVFVTLDELLAASEAAWNGFPVVERADKEELRAGGELVSACALAEKFGAGVDYWLWQAGAARVLWIARLEDNDGEGSTAGARHCHRRIKRRVRELMEAANGTE